jgi:hypothetical protein
MTLRRLHWLVFRPNDRRVTVLWEDQHVLGDYRDSDDNPHAVRVEADRAGSLVLLRLQPRDLGITTPRYRWAVQL